MKLGSPSRCSLWFLCCLLALDVITRTTFHLQVRIRNGTDDQTETGPDRVGTDSGSGPTSETCAHRFDEFRWIPPFDEIYLHRVSNQGLRDNCTQYYPLSQNRLPFWVLAKLKICPSCRCIRLARLSSVEGLIFKHNWTSLLSDTDVRQITTRSSTERFSFRDSSTTYGLYKKEEEQLLCTTSFYICSYLVSFWFSVTISDDESTCRSYFLASSVSGAC